MANKTTANIMIIGRTGAGKSELINYLLGEKMAKTGCGEPITQSFDEYYYTFRDGFRIRVFDSVGLEVDRFKDIVEDIESFVTRKCKSDDLSEWLHLVFYCINSGSKRVEPIEIDFMKRIQELTQTRLVVVLTHCPEGQNDDLDDIEDLLREKLGDSILLYRVNSVYKKKRSGEVLKTFGRKKLLDEIDEIIWVNTSNRLISEYAEKLRSGIANIIFEIDKELCGKVDTAPWINLARDIVSAEKLDESEKKLKAFVSERDDRFYKSQQALLEMYYAFRDYWGGRSDDSSGIEPKTIVENVVSLDSLYSVLRKTRFISERAKEIDELPFVKRIPAKLKYRIKVREELKGHIHSYCLGMIDKIPSQEEIEAQYNTLLCKTRAIYEKHTPLVYKYDKKMID